jgi:hypothetical protein
MNEDIPKVNTGLIEGSGTKSLYVAGTIPYEVRLESGDWRPYITKEEHQYSDNTDTMACVSFSCNNSLEVQTKFLTGQEVNYSDRFLAKMSGTTIQGNWLDKVADTARTIGLVKEEEWPAPGNYTWESYYASIPQEVIDKAFKPNTQYEVIGFDKASLLYHLKQAPIQVSIPAPHPNHAVVLLHIEGDTAYYFDTYIPALKTINVNKISYALKIVLKGINMNPSVKTLNIDGTIYAAFALNDPKDIPFINKFLNINIVQNPDGTIPTDINAHVA